MIDSWQLPVTGGEALLWYLLNVAAKATLLLAAAIAGDALLGRRRGLARSSLWQATLVALAVLPIAMLLLPNWQIFPGDQRREMAMALPAQIEALPAVDADDRPQPHTDALTSSSRAMSSISDGEPLTASDWRPLVAGGIVIMYLLGVAGLTIRFVASLAAVAALTKRAEPIADERWRTLLADWCGRLAIVRPVRLLMSSEVAVPVEIGALRPRILLPPGVMQSNDVTTRIAVLVHELGHVRRGDYGWNLLLRALSIIYWPHPFIWLAVRRMAQLREQACDELCIHWLGGVQAYRARLIELAAGLLAPRPIASLGMAMSQPTKLARRLEWIEASRGRPDCQQSVLARRLFIAATVALCGVLGTVTLSGTAAEEQQPDTAAAERPTATGPKTSEKRDELTAPASAVQDSGADPGDAENAGKTDEEGGQAEENEPVRVYVQRVNRGDLTIETSQMCSFAASQTAIVYARTPGFVKRMTVELGDHVKKGQTLAELEATPHVPEVEQAESLVIQAEAEQQKTRAQVSEAKASLEASQADVEKCEADLEGAAVTLSYREKQSKHVKQLVEQRAVDAALADEQEEKLGVAKAASKAAKSALESAKRIVRKHEAAVVAAEAILPLAAAQVRLAKSRLAEIKKRGELAQIVSPMDGVIVERHAQVGDYAGAPGTKFPLCIVANLQRMRAEAQVPEREALAMQRGGAARIFVDALRGKAFETKVSRVGYKITPRRTLPVELEMDNSDGRLLPGMLGTVAFASDVHRDVISVPSSALSLADEQGVYTYTVVDGRMVQVKVEVGEDSFDRAEILSGLKEGDVVITGLANPKQKPSDWRKHPRVEIVDRPAER